MSGGFFRGTSADQDTRFSNKQAKLLKSQKFAAELENLVDMTKVKMDVMKPWIAKRVTELIGFEDEVLINFIYGLLEGKAVNGKQVQIQLTGFMERNTGKFMKELWVLLLSAQQNVSGVPQPFLDAKEEESKKKKEDSDRIANENRMKKELDQEKTRMDNDGEMSREKHAVRELDRKHEPDRTADPRKDGSRGRSRGSGSSESGSGSSPIRRKHSMSPSKSPSSRSHSKERQRSRSITRVTRSKSRSVSSERPHHSSRRRSVTPRRKFNTRRSRSPLGRRFYSNWRSVSPTHRRSLSPKRNRFRPALRHRSRSPLRHRSRSPLRRRSRSPIRCESRTPPRYRSRSPERRRSRSPIRCESRTPPRYRSRSPERRRSPSPVRRRSPARRRSPPPARRRSPPPARRRSPPPVRSPSLSGSISRSPVRRSYRHNSSSPHKLSTSPVRGRPSMHDQKRSSSVPRRSPSPQYSSSQSPTRPSSFPPRRRGSPRRVARSPSQSPDRQDYIKERSVKNSNGSKAVERKPTVSLRAPQRDMLEQNDLRRKERDPSLSAQKAPIGAEGSMDISFKEGRASSPRGSPYRKRGGVSPENLTALPKAAELKPSRDSSETNKDDEEKFSRREIGDPKYRSSGRSSKMPAQPKDSLDAAVTPGLAKSRKTQLTNSDRLSDKVDNMEYRDLQDLSTTNRESGLSGKGKDTHVDRERSTNKNRDLSDDRKGDNRLSEMESLPELSRTAEKNGLTESPSKKLDDHTTKVKEKRKHKRSDTQDADSDDYSSNDSYGERREAKKRRKEEKKLKKQERRKRREERRLRKQGRREEKLKSKAVDPGSSSSNSEADHSVDNRVSRQDSRTSDVLDAEAEKKRIEIELREKALESLRAKRGIDN